MQSVVVTRMTIGELQQIVTDVLYCFFVVDIWCCGFQDVNYVGDKSGPYAGGDSLGANEPPFKNYKMITFFL